MELAFSRYHQGQCSIEELADHLKRQGSKTCLGFEDCLLRKITPLERIDCSNLTLAIGKQQIPNPRNLVEGKIDMARTKRPAKKQETETSKITGTNLPPERTTHPRASPPMDESTNNRSRYTLTTPTCRRACNLMKAAMLIDSLNCSKRHNGDRSPPMRCKSSQKH